MGVPNKATGPFREYDFSSSAGVFAIPSCQGTAEGFREMDEAGGIVGLANAVKALRIPSGGKWRVEATGSSIGNYKPNWLSQMLGVSRGTGRSVATEIDWDDLACSQACAGLTPRDFGYTKLRQRPHGQAFNVPTREAANSPADLPLKIVFHTQHYSELCFISVSQLIATLNRLVSTEQSSTHPKVPNTAGPCSASPRSGTTQHSHGTCSSRDGVNAKVSLLIPNRLSPCTRRPRRGASVMATSCKARTTSLPRRGATCSTQGGRRVSVKRTTLVRRQAKATDIDS